VKWNAVWTHLIYDSMGGRDEPLIAIVVDPVTHKVDKSLLAICAKLVSLFPVRSVPFPSTE